MNRSSARKRISLETALDSRDWSSLYQTLSTIPTSLPPNCTPQKILVCLEEARTAADILVEACDFSIAFESAFNTRTALLGTQTPQWAVAALKGFTFDERVTSRLAALLASLGIGADGRGIVGNIGAVDHLALAWKEHPACIHIVTALSSLCAGHIDNVSRVMRRRGISTALQVLCDSEFRENIPLIEATLLLIGMCAICMPDHKGEAAQMVPTLLSVLAYAIETKRSLVAKHAVMALANIADCWRKEGVGYHLGDVSVVVEAVVDAWQAGRKSKGMASAASWALAALSERRGSVQFLDRRAADVFRLAGKWKAHFNTAATLYEIAVDVLESKKAQYEKPQRRKGTRSCFARPMRSTLSVERIQHSQYGEVIELDA